MTELEIQQLLSEFGTTLSRQLMELHATSERLEPVLPFLRGTLEAMPDGAVIPSLRADEGYRAVTKEQLLALLDLRDAIRAQVGNPALALAHVAASSLYPFAS